MIKYFISIGLLISTLFCQSDDIPYDWSGQYGAISQNGRLMWNQDWSGGVLLFDGTFSIYPTRLGLLYQNNFKMMNATDNYNQLRVFPDSSRIKSRINNERGDFSYDQLEFDLEFAEKNRIIGLNAFKRSYDGPYGQYTSPNSKSNPLQQSYRFDYSNKDESQALDLSIGYFKTDSRLNSTDLVGFNHQENSLGVGLGYQKTFSKFEYNLHGAVSQQYYKLSSINSKAYLNRIHLNQFVSKALLDSTVIRFGLQVDDQKISQIDSTKNERLWSTLYGSWEKENLSLKLGTTFGNGEIIPYYQIWANSREKSKIMWGTYIKYEAIPTHFATWNKSWYRLFEKWFTAHLNVGKSWNNLLINLAIDRTNIKPSEFIVDNNDNIIICGTDPPKNMLASSLSAQIPIFRDWKLNTDYRHTFKHNLYSDGIGDRLSLGIVIAENIFKNNLFAQFRLWGDAYLNHSAGNGYGLFYYDPLICYNDEPLPNYWVFNMEISAKVSKMILKWKVNNILQTLESTTSNTLFPNVNAEYLLIKNSNNFPPMNRFVTFNIIWEFDN